jgi:hypothetical protein
MKFKTNLDLKFNEGSVYTRNSLNAAAKGANYVSADAYRNAKPAEYQGQLEKSSIGFKMDTREKDNKFTTKDTNPAMEGKRIGQIFDK